ncbi:diguanylate phosphodiesterase [Pseudomonas hunanensis]|uniref:Diguanylate phosphodiesterase n=1 Tax=Pseudomonas hunanensis TaxID=1247546 RepID=A0ACC9N169_9PSED|nr:diguanylate phosphodiesterase [Pseudomonas hunanensis]
MAAATVNGGGKLASRAGLFAGNPAPTSDWGGSTSGVDTGRCRRGFTREYGSRGNGERRVIIGQQGRPLRG